MPRLIALYIRQVVLGFGLAGIFVAMLLYFNVANLWHLVTATQGGMIAVTMLFVFNAIVFSGVQFAITIMRMTGPDGPGGGGRRPLITGEKAQVNVAAGSRDGRRR